MKFRNRKVHYNYPLKNKLYGEKLEIEVQGVKMDQHFQVSKVISTASYENSGPSLADIENYSFSGSSFECSISMTYNTMVKK